MAPGSWIGSSGAMTTIDFSGSAAGCGGGAEGGGAALGTSGERALVPAFSLLAYVFIEADGPAVLIARCGGGEATTDRAPRSPSAANAMAMQKPATVAQKPISGFTSNAPVVPPPAPVRSASARSFAPRSSSVEASKPPRAQAAVAARAQRCRKNAITEPVRASRIAAMPAAARSLVEGGVGAARGTSGAASSGFLFFRNRRARSATEPEPGASGPADPRPSARALVGSMITGFARAGSTPSTSSIPWIGRGSPLPMRTVKKARKKQAIVSANAMAGDQLGTPLPEAPVVASMSKADAGGFER